MIHRTTRLTEPLDSQAGSLSVADTTFLARHDVLEMESGELVQVQADPDQPGVLAVRRGILDTVAQPAASGTRVRLIGGFYRE